MSRSQILVLASCVCFAVALLSSLGVVVTPADSWAFGGALAFVLSFLA